MRLPDPEPGLVIRYAYLWRWEADQGREGARKDRPCAVILAINRMKEVATVYVAPITHTPPPSAASGLAVPPGAKRRLGLGLAPSWIITTEFNSFAWPGSDLRKIGPSDPESAIAYGQLPNSTTERMLESFRKNLRAGRARVVRRSE